MLHQIKKVILMIVFSLSYITGFGQFINDAKLLCDLRGKPKSCLTFGYNIMTKSGGKLSLNSYTKVIFNEQGQVIERYNASTVNQQNIDDEYKHTLNMILKVISPK